MTITATHNRDVGIHHFASGSHLDDASTPEAFEVDLGFRPRYVNFQNATDRIGQEWYEGMGDADAIQTVAAGTRTLATSSGITVTDRGFSVTKALILQNKQYHWFALG